ncbi:MAG: hypothetical protein SFU27_07520 [Thermonemataceae bacterium]|nr:hypothetical protein [Thermonemataceae bacterium]
MKSLFLFLGVLIVVNACQNNPSDSQQKESIMVTNKSLLNEGKELLEKNCYTCHSPKTPMDSRIAPPMVAVKKHYINSKTTKEVFVKEFVNFASNPSKEKSKMPGAVQKFGLMPKMVFAVEDLKKIAVYIYDNDIESPEWFEKHYQEEHKKHKNK